MENLVSADVEAINRLRNEAFEKGDIWNLTDYFNNDMLWMPIGEEAVVGKDAVCAWATCFDGQAFKFQIIPQ